jgi:FKBP-type peptidyl-prolyl cis-trans isomerase SlyD
MSVTPNKYIAVAYQLFSTDRQNGKRQMEEEATAEEPFQFISGLGVTLDAFEAQIKDLEQGGKFDFTLSCDDAYGDYEKNRVIEVEKKIFEVGGYFDKEHIFAGNTIPLENADGMRFFGRVVEVKDATVVLDLNHRLAGKDLNFVGTVVETRDATKEELQGMLNMLSGEGCGCGCDGCEDECDGGCGHDHGDGCGHEHGGSCGCGHHHHEG